jgi:hypothetical protein
VQLGRSSLTFLEDAVLRVEDMVSKQLATRYREFMSFMVGKALSR